jgi:hypothetical protein
MKGINKRLMKAKLKHYKNIKREWCEPHDHVVMQRHQFPESQENQVW